MSQMDRNRSGGHTTNDAPPPIPPRTYVTHPQFGQHHGAMGTSSHGPGIGTGAQPQSSKTLPSYGAKLDGFPVQGAPTHAWTMTSNTNNTGQGASPLMNLSPPSTLGPVPRAQQYIMDLEGIDFTATTPKPNNESGIKSSSSMEDITQTGTRVYPDISSMFREINTPQSAPVTAPKYGDWNMSFPQTVRQPNRNSLPSSYGWDPSFMGMASGANLGSTSVPTTPLQAPVYPQSFGFGPSAGAMGVSGFQATGPDTKLTHSAFPVGAYNSGFASAAGATSAIGPQACDNKTEVPSEDFSAWADMAQSGPSPWGAGDSAQEPEGLLEPGKNKDLIELGFEGILTVDEKEYFSLEYFDPLHRKGRTDSMSSKDGPQYSFAKPPEDESTEHVVNSGQNTWVAFDDDDVFGLKDLPSPPLPEKEREKAVESAPSDVKSTDAADEASKSHAKLRKKIYVDDESDAFCQMVAELKKEYKSTDEKMNLGFIVSPICDKQQDAMSVKIVVHSDFSAEPFSFTSDVHSLVEHIISHVVYSCLSSVLPGHMIEALKSVDFILKVYDRSEYLLNEFPLSKYSYTHNCLKMDQDLCFQVMRRQDVALPFLRTIDDDQQRLYFPQEHVRDSDVTRESLEILMDTFYTEIERVNDTVLKDQVDRVQFQSISQAVKAICNILSNIETIEISKALSKVESILSQLKGSVTERSSTLEHEGGGYATIQRSSVAVKCTLIPGLEESLEALVGAVKKLVRIYCQAFHTDFHLDSRIDQPWDPQDVTYYNENFIVQICTIHRIPVSWAAKFDEYRVVCGIYHGKKKLSPDVSTTCASTCTSGLVPHIIWDEWLTFEEISLCLLPRETRLCITLLGLKNLQSGNTNTPESQKLSTAVGGVTIQLFNKRGYMLQGSQLVPFQMNSAADPVTPFCSTLQPDSALLQVNLPDFGKQVMFCEALRMEDRKRPYEELAPEIQDIIKDVMQKDCVQSCTADQLEILWSYREFLHGFPRLLPWILQAAQTWDWASLPAIYSLLKSWKTLQPMQSLELLLPQYPDIHVREFAVDCLRKMPTDDLIDFIPQLIQALKYESYHSSPLARLLLEQSCKSVRFAHQFFWLLKGATQDSLYKRRYELMFVALVSVAGEALYQEFKKQEELVKILTNTAEQVQQAKDKDNTLKRNLETLYEKFLDVHHILLPHNPGYEVSGLEMNSCSYFPSNALPLKLVFKNKTSTACSVYAMFKVGDDLRQDMLTMQIVRIMDRLWLKEGLDLKMVTFNCLPTGPRKGFIELITESETLRKIQVSSGVTGSFKDRGIKEWLQKHNPTELEYQKAVENFTLSCAGYCVMTYVLGVCDRHNDNIMLKQSGHMFHIDFNKFLGDSQMFGSIKRDRVKFVLTSDMAYVIKDGDQPNDKFQHFIDVCCQAFNIIRKHANLFINLFSLMLRSGIPGISEKGVEFVQKALLPGLTNTQASVEFTRMIEHTLSARSTQLNFFIHNLAQMKFVNHTEGTLLSFVPKTYSQQTDGRIKKVELCGYQKRYQPEKHYIYTIKIEREHQKVSSYVFRTFYEFSEFHSKLVDRFRLIAWSPLSGRKKRQSMGTMNEVRVLLGRSHIKAVAENRKAELEKFLKELFETSPEISHCDLVYTFFHPLLRDEQEAQKERLMLPKLKETPVLLNRQGRGGQVKLSVEYIKDSLHIMIMHAKDLPGSGSELPSPYVKTYLLPDPEKQTKRKTKVVKNTTHPTYNELIEYKMPPEVLRLKTLQVTIWDHDMLKENNLLGTVYVRLRDLDLSRELTEKEQGTWYKLEKIQITDPTTLA